VTLGIVILVLAIVRVLWRVSTPLPPWAGSLSRTERHVAAHVAFFAALAVHLVLVFGHRARTGESLLRRMV
jgi:cytochrome b561